MAEAKTWLRRAKFPVGAAPVRIANNAPSRKSLLLQNTGTSTIQIDTDPDVSAGSGIELLPGGSASFTLIFDFAFTTHEFWAIAATGASTCEVWQTIENAGAVE